MDERLAGQPTKLCLIRRPSVWRHFYWCIYGIFFNSSRRGNSRRKGREKGHPRVWCVIIFLMTVSSEKMDQIQEGSNCGCSKRFISRHVLREGIRHWLRRRKQPWPMLESQKNNKQHPTSVYNYQLHPFLWDEIRSLGHGIISVVLKRRKKGTKGLLTASFCLVLQPKARQLLSSIARSVSPISFWCPDLKVKDLPYYSVPPRFYL